MNSIRGKLYALFLFAAALGFMEALSTVYIRKIIPLEIWTLQAADLDSLVKLLENYQVLWTEQARQTAVAAAIAAAAFLAAEKNGRIWLGAVLIPAGTLKIWQYLFLLLLIRWPSSPDAYDIIAFIPSPFIGPVYLPVLIGILPAFLGVYLLLNAYREENRTYRTPEQEMRKKRRRKTEGPEN